MAEAFVAQPDGLTLWLRLTPKGGRDGVDGVEILSDGRAVLRARVRAAPEDGRANAALIELIAKTLGAPRGSVSVAAGGTSRLKKLFVAGDGDRLAQKLAESLAQTAK